MTTFNEHDHPRGAAGRFAIKELAEDTLDLTGAVAGERSYDDVYAEAVATGEPALMTSSQPTPEKLANGTLGHGFSIGAEGRSLLRWVRPDGQVATAIVTTWVECTHGGVPVPKGDVPQPRLIDLGNGETHESYPAGVEFHTRYAHDMRLHETIDDADDVDAAVNRDYWAPERNCPGGYGSIFRPAADEVPGPALHDNADNFNPEYFHETPW